MDSSDDDENVERDSLEDDRCSRRRFFSARNLQTCDDEIKKFRHCSPILIRMVTAKIRLATVALLLLPSFAFSTEKRPVSVQALPNFGANAYSASHRQAEGSNLAYVYGKTFIWGSNPTRSKIPVYFGLQLEDGTSLVYETGITRQGVQTSEMIGTCQWIYSGSGRPQDQTILLSEINSTTEPVQLELFVVTGFMSDEERMINEQICKYSPTPHPSIRTIVPTAEPFATIPLRK